MPTAPAARVTQAELDAAAVSTESENASLASAVGFPGQRIKNRPEPQRTEETNPPIQPLEPKRVPLHWAANQGKCRAGYIPHASHRVAELHFVADPGPSNSFCVPDLYPELFTSPVTNAVQNTIDATESVAHLRKLQSQQAIALREKRLAEASLTRLRGERQALEIEVPAGLPKKLQALDVKIAEQSERLSAAEKDLATLRPLLDSALAYAEREIEVAFVTEARKANERFSQRRTDLIQRMTDAVQTMLVELDAVDTAKRNVELNLRGNVLVTMQQHLRKLPEPNNE